MATNAVATAASDEHRAAKAKAWPAVNTDRGLSLSEMLESSRVSAFREDERML